MSQAGVVNPSSSPGIITFLEGNSGGRVGPDNTNTIYLLGAGGISVTGTAISNTLNIVPSGFVSNWTDITSGATIMAINNGYTANSASLLAFVLPSVANSTYGSMIALAGKGTGGWTLTQNSTQVIHFGLIDTTTGVGGSLSSTSRRDVVFLLCTTAGTDWTVVDCIGNISWN